MKKLFNYALLAAALLVGVNVNAGNEVSLSINGGAATEYAKFTEALKAICEAAKNNTAEQNTEATIKLLMDVSGVAYDATWMTGDLKDGDKVDRIKLNKGERITIDLDGYVLTSDLRFNVYRGSMILTGKVGSKVLTNISQFITLYGNQDAMDAESGYSYCRIDENVVLAANAKGVYYCAGMYTPSIGAKYSGIKFDIYGQLISTADPDGCAFASSGNMQYTRDQITIPVINIYPSAVLQGSDALTPFTEEELTKSNNKILNKIKALGYTDAEARQYKNTSAGLYCPAIAEFNIEGTVKGGVGIYIKGGKVNIKNAKVYATATEYWKSIPNGNGFYGAGSAVILDSNEGYGLLEGVDVSGETEISSVAGYGIEETVTSGETKVPGVVISEGTISGGAGSISTTVEVKDNVVLNGTITGGNFSDDAIVDYISQIDGIITPIDNGDGTTSYIVATKEPTQVWKNDITTAVAGDYVEISGAYNKSLTNDVEAAYLVAKNTAKVTIPTGKTLTVGEIVLDKDAQIVVEKGATLIVEGTKGIVANQATNIVLKSEENAPAFFLLDPDVTSNKTPKATVNFVANSFAEAGGAYQYQYFGAPMVGGAIEKIEPLDFTGKTLFLSWNKTAWETIGTIDNGVESMDYSKFNTPFGFYALCAVAPQGSKQTYAMTGNLYGNTNPQIKVLNNYTALSNGFTGDMGFDAMLNALGVVSIQQNVWIPQTDEDSELQWIVYNKVRDGEDIHPMGTFMVKNDAASANLDLNYENIVWEPATKDEVPNSAPKANNFAKATVRVNGCGLNDIVTVAEDDQFSADFDNGYDAEKYENTKIRFYVNADKEYDVFATDNLNNAFVGLMTTKAGKYTISFEDVTANFALVDTKTNARIEMSEGATYEFLAEAGEDAYRFMIVEAAKAPTNTPATKAAVKATKALINDQIVINNGERFFNMLGTDVK